MFFRDKLTARGVNVSKEKRVLMISFVCKLDREEALLYCERKAFYVITVK